MIGTTNPSHLRLKTSNVSSVDPTVSFQSIDWIERDFQYKYEVICHGVTSTGLTISVVLTGFRPYFYIRVPNGESLASIRTLIEQRIELTSPSRAFLLEAPQTTMVETKEYQDIYGFSNGEKMKAVKVTTTSQSFYYLLARTCRDLDMQLYGSNFGNAMKLVTDQNWLFCGWFRLKEAIKVDESIDTKAQLKIRCHYTNVIAFEDNAIAPILQASMDIEAYGSVGFPNPSIPDDCVTQIATVFKRYGDPQYCLKTVYVLGEACRPVGDDVLVRCFLTEKDLLLNWAMLIEQTDPDIMYTYNGDKFDYGFLFCRAKRYASHYDRFLKALSRSKTRATDLKEVAFNSAAYGSSKYERPVFHGRINFDLLIYVQRQFQMESYSLNSVSESFLKDKKMDLSPKEMMRLFKVGDADSLGTIAEYCVKDTLLPQCLVEKLLVIESLVEMSNITHIPFSFNLERGQQIKVFSQIVRFSLPLKYLVPDLRGSIDVDDVSYKGAVVLVAKAGFYECVSTLDFASLYPSIIMAHRLCYSSLVMDDAAYGHIEGVDYRTFEWEEEEEVVGVNCAAITKSTGSPCKKPAKYGDFCGTHKPKDDSVQHRKVRMVKYSAKFAYHDNTVLPKLLDELYKRRKAVRRMIPGEKDQFVRNLLDKRQLAIKVSMNSCYGFLAAHMLKAKSIAATVTSVGRQMIMASKEYTELQFPQVLATMTKQQYRLDVVYGDTDSIFIQFIDESPVPLNDRDLLEDVMRCSEECAKRITAMFNAPPIKLEFEKVYFPLLLFKKKRYIGSLFTSPDRADKIDKKGVVSKRRDNCPLIRAIYNDITKVLMDKRLPGIQESIEVVSSYCTRLINGDIPLKELTLSKSLAGSYKKPEQMAHVMLSRRLEEKGFEERFQSGDRIPFVFVLTEETKSMRVDMRKSVDVVEHPKIVELEAITIDVAYYLRKQIEKPVLSFYKDIAGDQIVKLFEDLYLSLHQNGLPGGLDRVKVKLPKDDEEEVVDVIE